MPSLTSPVEDRVIHDEHDCMTDDDSDFDFDEEYFARTYQPLSNLPTPPPSSRNSSVPQSPQSLVENGGLLDSELLGPAIHLVNLIPPAASLALPSVSLVHELLRRTGLKLDEIALAVCVLDSISSKFALNWRLRCPPSRREGSTTSNEQQQQSKRYTLPAAASQLHIDCVKPEVIVLGALIIAVKFLEDSHAPTQYYRSAWGNNLWTCEQINITERCIMEDLNYRILPLWDERLIGDALKDMERAGRQALLPLPPAAVAAQSQYQFQSLKEQHKRCVSSGAAVYRPGLQLTPAGTPLSEYNSPPPFSMDMQ
ncbi:uncharacterized protein B0T23DRAFT_398466 [Neurospora hispaniola]|uniref:Cyclin N-terminal domain-containing protein n=1 Tax=Neurospora hispaniola TaxID=588809 RepID=A0AAJ0MNH3_9PEZI|nr:hypothetical protein B0T23DRAFT_398466 [Neurospora hispaniola]